MKMGRGKKSNPKYKKGYTINNYYALGPFFLDLV